MKPLAIGAWIGAGLGGMLLASPMLAFGADAETGSGTQEAGVAQIVGWIDETLDAGREASHEPPPAPALGEGAVGRAIGWITADGDAPADEQPATSPEPPAPRPQEPLSRDVRTATVPAVAPVRAAAPATPAAVAAMPVSAAVDEGPMRLVGEEPARADLAPERGLLLPLN